MINILHLFSLYFGFGESIGIVFRPQISK